VPAEVIAGGGYLGRGNTRPFAHDGQNMERIRITTVASLIACAVVTGLAVAAPAQADSGDEFLASLADAGILGIDPATAVAVGQQVCPMLSEPGQHLADVAATVADAVGRPLPPATMFTGLAISVFCPGAVASLADGHSPVPPALLDVLPNLVDAGANRP
jgi:Protein of unknown function (DUF732)